MYQNISTFVLRIIYIKNKQIKGGLKLKYFKINEFARITGLSASTLRNWHKKGLLIPLLTPYGHRRYTVDMLKEAYKNRNRNDLRS